MFRVASDLCRLAALEPSVVGEPRSIEMHEFVDRIIGEVIGFGMTERIDGDAQLGQVLRAMRTRGEVGFQALPINAGETPIEVIGHQLNRLAAHEGPATSDEEHRHSAFISSASR
jgi:hypothetical protein